MDKPITDPILDKIRFHKSRIQNHEERIRFHQDRIDEWESVLAQVQALQRQEQPNGQVDQFTLGIAQAEERACR